MRLTILGTSTPYPRPGNPCSGYLVQAGESSVWMDAGTGTLAELQRHISLAALGAIWISHAHVDHAADLLAAYQALRFSEPRPKPVPLIGSPELLQRLAGFLGEKALKLFPRVFSFVPMEGPGAFRCGELSLSWLPVKHSVPAFGLRLDSEHASLGYSGDTGPCQQVVRLAGEATALLCEAGGISSPQRGRATHSTPEDAGQMAAEARAERLIVTHIATGMSGEAAAARAQSTFEGPVDVARPGHVFDLRSNEHLF